MTASHRRRCRPRCCGRAAPDDGPRGARAAPPRAPGSPAGAHAKTGTAQYEAGGKLKLDAWLMGYDGDIAFAIVVQDSGGLNGGPLDGPVMAKFFNALGTQTQG